MENKAVMISVKPKWCNFIANEEKKIEIRKTKPNLKVPFKCLLYCTKASKKHQTICGCHVLNDDELFRLPDGKIKYGDSIEMMVYDDCYTTDNFLNGKVIGEFTCDRISEYSYISDSMNEFTYNKNSESFYSISPDDCKSACLTQKDLLDYGKGKTLYGWHISDLVLYDKPKKITEFRKFNRKCEYSDLGFAIPKSCEECPSEECRVQTAPQSWCYVDDSSKGKNMKFTESKKSKYPKYIITADYKYIGTLVSLHHGELFPTYRFPGGSRIADDWELEHGSDNRGELEEKLGGKI